ncbi:hypothetical protein Tco_0314197, partial [Tanacetum coccineum]
QSESVSVFDEDSDPEQAQRDKEMQKNLALLAKAVWESKDNDSCWDARETVGSPVMQQTGIQCFNCVPLQAEQADWLEDTDEEIDEQELEAHYSYMANIQEVSPVESSSTDTPLEQVQNHD